MAVLTLSLFPTLPSPSCTGVSPWLGRGHQSQTPRDVPESSTAFTGQRGRMALAVIAWGSKHNPHKLGDLSGEMGAIKNLVLQMEGMAGALAGRRRKVGCCFAVGSRHAQGAAGAHVGRVCGAPASASSC